MVTENRRLRAERAVERIIADVVGRSGLREVWESTDSEMQMEISRAWETIVTEEMSAQIPRKTVNILTAELHHHLWRLVTEMERSWPMRALELPHRVLPKSFDLARLDAMAAALDTGKHDPGDFGRHDLPEPGWPEVRIFGHPRGFQDAVLARKYKIHALRRFAHAYFMTDRFTQRWGRWEPIADYEKPSGE